MWYHGYPGSTVPYELALSAKIERAFKDFWSVNDAPATFDVAASCFIDFRLMQQVKQDTYGDDEEWSPVFRRELPAAGSEVCSQPAACYIQWGHGQDVKDGSAFTPYSPQISLLLEDAFACFWQGGMLKGVTFTSTNGADYLVDFERLQQTRLATRNIRPVYRHQVSPTTRGAAGQPGLRPLWEHCDVTKASTLKFGLGATTAKPDQAWCAGRQSVALATGAEQPPGVSCSLAGSGTLGEPTATRATRPWPPSGMTWPTRSSPVSPSAAPVRAGQRAAGSSHGPTGRRLGASEIVAEVPRPLAQASTARQPSPVAAVAPAPGEMKRLGEERKHNAAANPTAAMAMDVPATGCKAVQGRKAGEGSARIHTFVPCCMNPAALLGIFSSIVQGKRA